MEDGPIPCSVWEGYYQTACEMHGRRMNAVYPSSNPWARLFKPVSVVECTFTRDGHPSVSICLFPSSFGVSVYHQHACCDDQIPALSAIPAPAPASARDGATEARGRARRRTRLETTVICADITRQGTLIATSISGWLLTVQCGAAKLEAEVVFGHDVKQCMMSMAPTGGQLHFTAGICVRRCMSPRYALGPWARVSVRRGHKHPLPGRCSPSCRRTW